MFTRDQIEEIKKKLIMLGTKDTQFPDAHKLNGEEIIAIVQDGENKKIPLSSIINDDFINVSKDTTEILTLSTAVSKIDTNNRKLGQVITFKDSANSWAIRQFTGSSLDNWNDISLWKSISGIDELKSQVETNAEDISVLSDEIERHDASILNLNTDVSKLKDKDIETSSSLSELNTKVDTLKSQADTNTSNISSLNTEVSTLRGKVDVNTTSISQINNTISSHDNRIAQINTTLEEHTESINAKITTDRIENGAVTSEKIATSAFDSTLSVSGKIAPADVVGEKINKLGKEVIAQDISFESGSVNYLNGKLVSSGKSIRTDAIPISEDVRIIGYFNRTLYKVYIVKYLNGVYAGYEQISVSGMNIDQLLQKDTSFDSFRLRVDVPNSEPDWSAQDILDSSASIYLQNSVVGNVKTLSSSVQEIENKITSTPSSFDYLLTMKGIVQLLQRMSRSYFTEIKKAYVNLNNLSVGSTFIFQTTGSSTYTYEYISVEEGDVILLTTKGNTVSAKAYAIIDAEDKVLAIHQEPISNAVLVMPIGAKKFIANTYTTTNDYALNYIMGKTADYDSAVEQLHTFDRGIYSFISSGNTEKLSNGPIPSGSIIIAVTGSDAVTSINLYDADGKNRLSLPIGSLPYTTTIDYYMASTYISGRPTLTIVTAGIKDVLDGLQKGVSPNTGAMISKKYRIANHDNDFSFDNIFVGQLVASFLQLQRNFEIPCDGVCISTDVENVVRLSETVTDEQMLKANVPYLYIDGVKRGTIVLFDTDGTPFIYDNTGKKRYLTLS